MADQQAGGTEGEALGEGPVQFAAHKFRGEGREINDSGDQDLQKRPQVTEPLHLTRPHQHPTFSLPQSLLHLWEASFLSRGGGGGLSQDRSGPSPVFHLT